MAELANRRYMNLTDLGIQNLGQIALVVLHPMQFEITIANIITAVNQAKLSMPSHAIAGGIGCRGQNYPPSPGSVRYEAELATLTASCSNVQQCGVQVELGEIAPGRLNWQIIE